VPLSTDTGDDTEKQSQQNNRKGCPMRVKVKREYIGRVSCISVTGLHAKNDLAAGILPLASEQQTGS
jgi:hypothetical protein